MTEDVNRYFVFRYNTSTPIRRHDALMAVACLSVRLSVCLSLCPVPDPKLRVEGDSKLKIGKKEAVACLSEGTEQFTCHCSGEQ